jgi:hypothetical protein
MVEFGVNPHLKSEMWGTHFCGAALGGGTYFGGNAWSGLRAQPLCGIPEELGGGEEQHEEQAAVDVGIEGGYGLG